MAAEDRAVIFISHKLHEVTAVADRVTVLRGGRSVATVRTADVTRRELAALMVGRDVELGRRREPAEIGDVVLDARGLTARGDRGVDALRDVSLTVRAGEVVGIAGVAGNGQRELAEVLTGLRPPHGRHRSRSPAGASREATRARRSGRASRTFPRTGCTRVSRRASASRRTSSSSPIAAAG